MALYQSIERIGSALGPIVFGWFAIKMDIQHAIGMGGAVCMVGNILFMLLYRFPKSEKSKIIDKDEFTPE